MRDELNKTGRPIIYSTEWDLVYFGYTWENGSLVYNYTPWDTVIFYKKSSFYEIFR
jgi:hypothetical protein